MSSSRHLPSAAPSGHSHNRTRFHNRGQLRTSQILSAKRRRLGNSRPFRFARRDRPPGSVRSIRRVPAATIFPVTECRLPDSQLKDLATEIRQTQVKSAILTLGRRPNRLSRLHTERRDRITIRKPVTPTRRAYRPDQRLQRILTSHPSTSRIPPVGRFPVTVPTFNPCRQLSHQMVIQAPGWTHR